MDDGGLERHVGHVEERPRVEVRHAPGHVRGEAEKGLPPAQASVPSEKGSCSHGAQFSKKKISGTTKQSAFTERTTRNPLEDKADQVTAPAAADKRHDVWVAERAREQDFRTE